MKIEEINYPTICLNMIVKNESKIITRLFDSVLSIIDTYCICDTGSNDNTIDIENISELFLLTKCSFNDKRYLDAIILPICFSGFSMH